MTSDGFKGTEVDRHSGSADDVSNRIRDVSHEGKGDAPQLVSIGDSLGHGGRCPSQLIALRIVLAKIITYA